MADNTGLPYSMDAEQALLGSILTDPSSLSVLNTMDGGFKSEYFYRSEHKVIYDAMLMIDTAGAVPEPVLVLEKIKATGTFDDAAGRKYLLELAGVVPSARNIEKYAAIVRDKYYLRSLITVSKEISEAAASEETEADKILDNAEQKIYALRGGRLNSTASKLSDVTSDVLDRLEKLNSDQREEFVGVPTGFGDLDKVISGIARTDLVIIGGRPAMGKTSFALNMMTNMATKKHKKVLFFSLEMSKEQIASRILASEAAIEGTKMRTGLLSGEDYTRLYTACELLSDAEIWFDDTSDITVPEMKARIRRLGNIDCVFIDYLQLMNGDKKNGRVNEISEITRGLKLMAKDLNVPVVVLSQLARRTESRGASTDSHRPQLADLRESGSIEQDADIVMMLFREEYYQNPDEMVNRNEIAETEVLVLKNRHGPTDTVKVGWDPRYTRFADFDKEHSDDDLPGI